MSPEFQAVQYQFAGHIRDPENVALIDGVEPRRMKIYNDLFYKNIEGFAAGAFPIFKSLLAAAAWQRLIREFLVKYRCSSPYFLEISQEFIAFLQQYDGEVELPVFALELAHYEWVELALDVADAEPDWIAINPNGALMDEPIITSPVAWPLCYTFPVQLIGKDYQPDAPPEQPTYLLVYRNRDLAVKFMEINSVTARLLELLGAEQKISGAELAATLAYELNYADTEALKAFLMDLLLKLHADGTILGTLRR